MERLGITATRSFTVRPNLPAELEDLRTLAANLRWSHDRTTQDLLAAVAPRLWESGVRDPTVLLSAADQQHLRGLSRDRGYVERVRAAAAELEVMAGRSRTSSGGVDGLVAYFSPEFGITEAIAQYSGGLGVLAGDHLKASGELGTRLVAVGLFYRHGYFHQRLSPDGWQTEHYVDNDPHTLPLVLEAPVVQVDLGGEEVSLQVWRAMLGPTPIYLLDADLPANAAHLRLVTDKLYGGNVEHRLRQEMVLGIGGVRALQALGEPVEVFHTNEGHAGFMCLERIRSLVVDRGLGFGAALAQVRASSVFTTHTPVPAGMERFDRSLMERYFGGWAADCGVDLDALMELGHSPGDSARDPFNMAVMGMRLSGFRNGVSRTHGATSRAMFGDLWPGVPTAEVPIGSVTNGVHPQSWTSPAMAELLEGVLGPPRDWHRADWSACEGLSDTDLSAAKDEDRARMVELARRRLFEGGIDAGRSTSELAWVASALDPSVTTICFARRMATHKRAALLLEQPDRLRALLADARHPVQFVFAGKAHTADSAGKEMIRRLVAFSQEPAHRGRFVFLADYDMAVARALVQGCDVWLNTPAHPLEASGTSGMKAALNGALNLSVLDGWWAEAFDPGSGPGGIPNGWGISVPAGDPAPDDPETARLDSDTLYELIENQVLPLAAPVAAGTASAVRPGPWWDRVRRSLVTLGPLVDAHRMAEDYAETMYRPALGLARELAADGHSGASELAAFLGRARSGWDSVRVGEVRVDERTGDLGSVREVEVEIDSGSLEPAEIQVQLLVGHLGAGGELDEPEIAQMEADAADAAVTHGPRTYRARARLSVPGRMGLTVRVLPRHEHLRDPIDAGLVTWAAS